MFFKERKSELDRKTEYPKWLISIAEGFRGLRKARETMEDELELRSMAYTSPRYDSIDCKIRDKFYGYLKDPSSAESLPEFIKLPYTSRYTHDRFTYVTWEMYSKAADNSYFSNSPARMTFSDAELGHDKYEDRRWFLPQTNEVLIISGIAYLQNADLRYVPGKVELVDKEENGKILIDTKDIFVGMDQIRKMAELPKWMRIVKVGADEEYGELSPDEMKMTARITPRTKVRGFLTLVP